MIKEFCDICDGEILAKEIIIQKNHEHRVPLTASVRVYLIANNMNDVYGGNDGNTHVCLLCLKKEIDAMIDRGEI